jgi:hypothetical protein
MRKRNKKQDNKTNLKERRLLLVGPVQGLRDRQGRNMQAFGWSTGVLVGGMLASARSAAAGCQDDTIQYQYKDNADVGGRLSTTLLVLFVCIFLSLIRREDESNGTPNTEH